MKNLKIQPEWKAILSPFHPIPFAIYVSIVGCAGYAFFSGV